MSKTSDIGSEKVKAFNEFLKSKGFRLFKSETQFSLDGSGRVTEEVERHISTAGLIISTFDRGPFDGCVSVGAGQDPWIDPCEALSSTKTLAAMLECYQSMFAAAKERGNKPPAPGDEDIAFTKTLRRDGVLIIKHTAGAFAGKSEIKLPGGGAFINACDWLSDKDNLMLALEVLDSMFEQQKKLRKKQN